MTRQTAPKRRFLEVLSVFLRLGLTSFGGPVAHLGYFHAEFVQRRKWLSDDRYADLVALCQFLPGPASSQVGFGLGVMRAGIWGGFAAWLGFTLPSALALTAFALTLDAVGDVSGAGWLRGLKLVAVAVVAQALWGMAVKLAQGRVQASLALLAAIAVLLVPTGLMQLLLIILGGLLGWRLLPAPPSETRQPEALLLTRRTGATLLSVFVALLLLLPVARDLTGNRGVALFDAFYRAGALVFGGGHVVLPLLEAEVVPTGWVDSATFTAGYGAAQAVPGPLFTFSAFLGAASAPGLAGVWAALVALVAIFTPSFLLLLGVWPFWQTLRTLAPVQASLRGVGAVVVGILLAALYDPVWTSAVSSASDVALALGAFLALTIWRWPPWLVVVLSAGVGAALSALA